MNITEASLFWGFLVVYGVVMYVLSPKSKTANSFYRGADDQGNPVGHSCSVFTMNRFVLGVYTGRPALSPVCLPRRQP